MNTVFLKPFGLLIPNSLVEDLSLVKWIAIKNQKDTGETQIVLGNDNPYQNKAMTETIEGKDVVRAIPYSYTKKMKLKH